MKRHSQQTKVHIYIDIGVNHILLVACQLCIHFFPLINIAVLFTNVFLVFAINLSEILYIFHQMIIYCPFATSKWHLLFSGQMREIYFACTALFMENKTPYSKYFQLLTSQWCVWLSLFAETVCSAQWEKLQLQPYFALIAKLSVNNIFRFFSFY